jgi:hypothetical protein
MSSKTKTFQEKFESVNLLLLGFSFELAKVSTDGSYKDAEANCRP